MKKLILFAILILWAVPSHASGITLQELAKDSRGKALLIRHALAPGTGDPSNFTLGDCSTQRNLNDEGREQAQAIGGKVKKAGLVVGKVFSSQWCRCVDTARLMKVGKVHPFPGLNSFYEQTEREEEFLSKLSGLLSSLDVKGELVIMVTHYVTISALLGSGVQSGGGVVLDLKDRSVRAVSDLP